MTLPASLNLDGFRAALRDALRDVPDDLAVVASCVDYLMDAGAELADVLLLFAGAGPTWVSEPWQEQVGWWQVLTLWCELTEPKRFSDQFTGTGYEERILYRFEAVRAGALDLQRTVDFINSSGFPSHNIEAYDVVLVMNPGSNPYPHVADAIVRARREHKRRVLGLFPDVVYERRLRFPLPDSQAGLRRIMGQAEVMLREGGWRVNVGITCTQNDERKEIRYKHILAAPDWIAPEPDLSSQSQRSRATLTGDVQVSYDGAFLGTTRDVRFTEPPAE